VSDTRTHLWGGAWPGVHEAPRTQLANELYSSAWFCSLLSARMRQMGASAGRAHGRSVIPPTTHPRAWWAGGKCKACTHALSGLDQSTIMFCARMNVLKAAIGTERLL